MTIKIFLHYDPYGNILGMTQEHEMFFERRVAAGEKIIEIPAQIDYKIYKIDVTTLELTKKSDAEIQAEFDANFNGPQYTTQDDLHQNKPALPGNPPQPFSIPENVDTSQVGE